MPQPQQVAQRFLDHFNNRDTSDLLAMVDADLRYNGRHGEGEGIHLLKEWVERATTTMTPRRWFGHDELTVVEVDVVWTSPSTGERTDRALWAIAFAIQGDIVSAISRFADVGEAVTKMGLLEQDAIPEIGFPDTASSS